MKTPYTFFLIILISAILFGCPNPQKYSEIPEINFRQIVLKDSVDGLGNNIKLLKLIFGITDGDGNIGLRESDSTGIFHRDSLYTNDLFTELFEVINGDTVRADSSVQRNFRIPYVVPDGQNKTLIAEIIIDIDFSYSLAGELPYDSIYYKFFVVDRDINKSNVEQTPVIRLDTVGFFPPSVN